MTTRRRRLSRLATGIALPGIDSERLRAVVAGRTVLVTGASSGIGEATARALAADGADVALLARRGERIESLAETLRRSGARALPIEADVGDREQAEAAVARAAAELGRLDLVVNNAGVMLLGPIVEAPVEEWQQMVQVNLLGLLYVSRAALPHLLAAADSEPRRVADLVNISSVAGRVARLGSGVYNATKHAVGAFSESLRQEVTGRHVRVTLIEPGTVATELVGHNRPEIRGIIEERIGGVEPMQAEDIADAISYVVTRQRHIAINEVLIRPTEQG
jgi:NADP-dependent 3-hydroxy acid dehydrogenase YdfG